MIRLFRKSDLHLLHGMICETIDTCYAGVYPPRAVQFFKQYHSEQKIMERKHVGQILVIENGGRLVATGSLIKNEIVGTFVHPDAQLQGYGKLIIIEIERIARENGLSELELSISLPSRRFYKSMGYQVLAIKSIDVGEGQRLDYWPGRKTIKFVT